MLLLLLTENRCDLLELDDHDPDLELEEELLDELEDDEDPQQIFAPGGVYPATTHWYEVRPGSMAHDAPFLALQ